MNKNSQTGFTLIEIIITMAIVVFVVSGIYVFVGNLTDASLRINSGLLANQEIQQALQVMVPELRSAAQSNTGVYPIIEAASTSIRFYSDVNGDSIFEEVHYYLEGDVFKKGVIAPSGEPLVYDEEDEKVRELVENMVTGAQIFSYFSAEATSTYADALPFPVNILDISKVKITLSVNKGTPTMPSIIGIEDLVTIRNLRYKE